MSQPLPQSARLSDADEKFLRDLAETSNFELGHPTGVQLSPDGARVYFLRAEPRRARNRLYALEVSTGELRELIKPEQVLGAAGEELSPEERARRERMRITGGGFTGYQLSRDGSQVMTSLSGRVFLVDVASGRAVEVAGPDDQGRAPFDAHLSPDGSQVAFVRGAELWVAPAAGGPARQLTQGAGGPITHGMAEFVAQEEMDRHTGHFWTADSRALVYQEADATGVELLHFVDPAALFGASSSMPYPRPGKLNVKVRLGIVPAAP
jgi:dipeptidyl-peptidase-4